MSDRIYVGGSEPPWLSVSQNGCYLRDASTQDLLAAGYVPALAAKHVGAEKPQSTKELCPGCAKWNGEYCRVGEVKFTSVDGALHCNKREPATAPIGYLDDDPSERQGVWVTRIYSHAGAGHTTAVWGVPMPSPAAEPATCQQTMTGDHGETYRCGLSIGHCGEHVDANGCATWPNPFAPDQPHPVCGDCDNFKNGWCSRYSSTPERDHPAPRACFTPHNPSAALKPLPKWGPATSEIMRIYLALSSDEQRVVRGVLDEHDPHPAARDPGKDGG